MSIPLIQTLADAVQFDGNPGQGRFSFDHLQNLPRTTEIQIDAMSYVEDPPAMGQVTTAVGFGPFRIGSMVGTSRMIWARDNSTMGGDLVNPVTGNAAKTFPGFRLPREPGEGGQWWSLICITFDKSSTASAVITYYLIPDQLGT